MAMAQHDAERATDRIIVLMTATENANYVELALDKCLFSLQVLQ